MDNPLLVTKTYLPKPRARAVRREGLFARLDSGLERRLILISAPAGFGKTTLLSAWLTGLESLSWQAAWLSLDRNDNDPYRFWAYVIAACQTVEAGFGENLQAALLAAAPAGSFPGVQARPAAPAGSFPGVQARPAAHGASPFASQAITTSLINAFAALKRKMVLVLDDYHVIHSAEIHGSLNDLLDHLPDNLRLVIATREDPPLAQARRRARGELAELRAADLRFSLPETNELFNACLGLGLTPGDTQVLHQRTDGWAVGLHLAGLSLQECAPGERQAFVSSFAGDDQFVFDYLMDEVFRHLDARQQTFLLRTSILDRLCGPLCQELTGFPDSPALLAQLERANLFVQPLDNRRMWYRYHPLFADLLRQRLGETESPAEIQHLYHQASAWHEREGLLAEAVSYAAPDPEFAAGLIERHVLDAFYRSEIYQVHLWLKGLPEAVLLAHPLLCAVFANTHVLTHLGPEAYARADQLLQIAESNGPLAEETAAYIAKFRAYLARFRGQPAAEVIRLAQEAICRIPAGSLRFRSALAYLQGVASLDIGNESAAELAFADALRTGLASGDWFNATAALDRQVYQLTQRGSLRAAAALCRDVLDRLEQLRARGETLPPIAGMVYIRLGSLLTEWNELEEAGQHLRRGLELLELTTLPEGQVVGCLALARLRAAQHEPSGALEAIQQAESLPLVRDYVRPNRIRILLLLARRDGVSAADVDDWAAGQRLELERASQPDQEQLLLARWLLTRMNQTAAQDHPSRASLEPYLAQQITAAQQARWSGWAIEALALQALLYQARKQPLLAIQALEQALRLGEPEGYTRLLVEFGSRLARLLRALAEPGSLAGLPSSLARYAARLLAIIESEEGREHMAQEQPPQSAAPDIGPARNTLRQPASASPDKNLITEALSAREMEVLRLLAEGLTNRQIAARLHLSPNTVRIHASTIYGKLGVASRTQAVARARVLGLIADSK